MRSRSRDRRSSLPTTPSSGSTLFQYSTARPPTNYSTNSWVQGSSLAPPVPPSQQIHAPPRPPRSPARVTGIQQQTLDVDVVEGTDDEQSDHSEDERDTPLYARSDYTKSTAPPRKNRSTVYTASVYPQTAATATILEAGDSQRPLSGQSEWASRSNSVHSRRATQRERTTQKNISNYDEGGRDDEDADADEKKWNDIPTAWSKSSYAAGRGGRGRTTYLDTVFEDETDAGQATGGVAGTGHDRNENPFDVENEAVVTRGSGCGNTNRSTGPSVMDLEYLANTNTKMGNNTHAPGNTLPKQLGGNQKQKKAAAKKRGISFAGGSPNNHPPPELLFSPGAHQRLGRMSVAPARFTLPPAPRRTLQHASVVGSASDGNGVTPSALASGSGTNPYASPGGLRFKQNIPRSLPTNTSWTSRLRTSNLARRYLTYRPFFTPILTIVSAMLLTLLMQNTGGLLEGFVQVQHGGFGSMVGEGKGVALGSGGWCQLDVQGPICRKYRSGDFVSSSSPFRIPGPDSLTPTLDLLLTALTTLTWLTATFHLTIASLHFFLLFGLSIPYDHFINDGPLPPLTGGAPPRDDMTRRMLTEEEVIQKEVDLRVRCERPPYEAYGWVWWAWWAHRRGPVGALLGVVVGLLGLCTLGVSVGLYFQVKDAAKEGSVSLGAGIFALVAVLILLADPSYASIKYLLRLESPLHRSNLSTFNDPPSPTPAAILLPPNIKPMTHIRHTGASSFFALPSATHTARNRGNGERETIFAVDPFAPSLPAQTGQQRACDVPTHTPGSPSQASPLDPETIRWLALYPHDTELVPLLASLRAGEENEDFVLSEVGLLYLRPLPDPTNPGMDHGDALLVPPAGEIRAELLQDAHLALERPGAHGAHDSAEGMMRELEQTFWWPGMEGDCQMLVSGCKQCTAGGGGGPMPMTALDTARGGQSAMAADMAMAMRKADLEAQNAGLA